MINGPEMKIFTKKYAISPDDSLLGHFKLVMEDIGVDLRKENHTEVTVKEGFASPYQFALRMRMAVNDDSSQVFCTRGVYWCVNPAGDVAFGVPEQIMATGLPLVGAVEV